MLEYLYLHINPHFWHKRNSLVRFFLFMRIHIWKLLQSRAWSHSIPSQLEEFKLTVMLQRDNLKCNKLSSDIFLLNFFLMLPPIRWIFCSYYPPASKAIMEVANLTERKNPHTPIYGVKEFNQACNSQNEISFLVFFSCLKSLNQVPFSLSSYGINARA